MVNGNTNKTFSIADRDLLIRLDEKFDVFSKQYKLDIDSIKDGTGKSIALNIARIDAHEKRLNDLEEKNKLNANSVQAYRVMAGAIGGVVFFLLTQLPQMLRNWGIIQ